MDAHTRKEAARAALQSALETYRNAAEADGLDIRDMADEIETACKESGIEVDVLAS